MGEWIFDKGKKMNAINRLFKSQSLAIGLAMFAMFFGAGNIIFPLAVGQYAGDQNLYAMTGLILTAAIMPVAGVIAMILFDGNYRQFFGRLGKTPGFLLALLIISLLGPLGSTPRCIALSYVTLHSSFPGLSPVLFSAIACGVIFLFTIRKNHILTLLGWVLTPLLLVSLITIIILGLFTAPETQNINATDTNMFLHGLKEGYNTMDLLAAFFFSSTILNILRLRVKKDEADPSSHIGTALRASIVGAFLLSVIYIGFSYLAAFHGSDLATHGKDELLTAITMKIAGTNAGVLVCMTIALACLTTAIALISAFTDFVQKEVFNQKISYELTLTGALLLTFFISTFEFTGISTFLGPILQVCYPGLIVLTVLNIAYRLKNFKPIKIPVFATFALSACLYIYL
jgi:LIVCS family branched-chain amino acid:cation transporter